MRVNRGRSNFVSPKAELAWSGAAKSVMAMPAFLSSGFETKGRWLEEIDTVRA